MRGFFVLVTDISERKRFELALQESEAKFSGIISISADAIISGRRSTFTLPIRPVSR